MNRSRRAAIGRLTLTSRDWQLLNWFADCALAALVDLLARLDDSQQAHAEEHLTPQDRQLVAWIAAWDSDTYAALLDLYLRIVDAAEDVESSGAAL